MRRMDTKETRKYALLMRPPCPGAVPRRGLIETHGEHFTAPSGHFAWGWAVYDRALTDEEIQEYELEEIGCVE